VEIPTVVEGNDYSKLLPDAVNEGMTALAHPGNVVLEWDPSGDHTKMRLVGGTLLQTAQISVFDATKSPK
jgi:hypothetical protein